MMIEKERQESSQEFQGREKRESMMMCIMTFTFLSFEREGLQRKDWVFSRLIKVMTSIL